MSKRSKKLPKKRQNSDYWIYGHHAVVGALMNENRVKYEVYFTSEAEKKLKNEIKLENINVISIKKTRDEIDLLLKGISNHQGICLRVEKIQTISFVLVSPSQVIALKVVAIFFFNNFFNISFERSASVKI